MGDYRDILRRLSIRDEEFVESVLTDPGSNISASELDRKAHALVQLGALIAIDPAPPSFMAMIETARRCGVTTEEIVGTLIAVMPAIGVTRVVSAAPKLALALGYDVAAALETLDDDPWLG